MYNINLSDEKLRYDITELLKLFIRPSEFRFDVPETGRTGSADLEGDTGSAPGSGISIAFPDDAEDKNAVKRYYFDFMSSKTGYRPPWGILTGVRPVKMVNEFFREGLDEPAIRTRLEKEYYLSGEKIDLLIETSRRQRSVNAVSCRDTASIYIGIPFCPSRCVYCSFTSNQADEERARRYLTAMFSEMEYVAGAMKRLGLYAETIYIGGGTPTSLTEPQFEELVRKAGTLFDRSRLSEFTVEAGRPDTITEQKLRAMVRYGCTRISINPQSMHQKTLDAIGRRHSPEETAEAYSLVKRLTDFKINMDIIAGLPGETIDDFRYTLDRIIGFSPSNITVHTLALKRSSRLREADEEYNYNNVSCVDEMTALSSRELHDAGYGPYYLYRQKQMAGNFENVGYSLPGDECIYNIRIMEEKQTNIAIGAGGISKLFYSNDDRLERIANVSNYEIYIERIAEMIQRKERMLFPENQ